LSNFPSFKLGKFVCPEGERIADSSGNGTGNDEGTTREGLGAALCRSIWCQDAGQWQSACAFDEGIASSILGVGGRSARGGVGQLSGGSTRLSCFKATSAGTRSLFDRALLIACQQQSTLKSPHTMREWVDTVMRRDVCADTSASAPLG